MYISVSVFNGFNVCLCVSQCTSLCLSLCFCVTHSSVVSLGMPLGRECSPLLLHRTTLSEHVQTSGQPDAGRHPLSSAPGEIGGRERDEDKVREIKRWTKMRETEKEQQREDRVKMLEHRRRDDESKDRGKRENEVDICKLYMCHLVSGAQPWTLHFNSTV